MITHEPYRWPGFKGAPIYNLRQGHLYARFEGGRLKLGRADRFQRGTFWTKPGDEVIESAMQARLHMLGIFQAKHSTRMSEWYDLPDGITQPEIVSYLDSLYNEIVTLDKRCDWAG